VQFAIIGSGNVGNALARRAGHSIVFGVRSPEAGHPDQAGIAQAAAGDDAVILAEPFAAAREAIATSPSNRLF
jgi:predicted dinucleotide-binding enzyme